MKIYVKLIDEGTVVFRPVEAEEIGDGFFRISLRESYDPKIEKWEFAPGAIIKCKAKILDGEKVLIAVEK